MKIIYVNCGIRNEYEGDLRSNKHFVSSSENKACKKFRSVWDWTRDLCDTGAVLYQLS